MAFKEQWQGALNEIKKKEIEKYGHILTDEEIDEMDRDQKEEKKLNKVENLTRSWKDSVPPRFKDATFDSFQCSNIQQKKVIEYLKTGRSAVIYGNNGTGKTHLAYASCLYQTQQGKESKYVLAFDFFNQIRQSFNGGNPERIVQELATYDYLVIDEVDKTQGSPTEFVYFYSLINKRYNQMLHTLLVTNADGTAMESVIGKSALDRVASDGKLIELSGENYRQTRRTI